MKACVGNDRAVLAICALAITTAAAAVFVHYLRWDFDDSFIVYRYALNLMQGNGWRYNLSENHNASTSVLNTLLVALAGLTTKNPRLAAHALGLIWLVASGVLLMLTMRGRYGTVYSSAAAVFLVLVLGHNLTWGIETNLFIALCLLFVYLELREKNTWYLLGLIVLARPDGVLILAAKLAAVLAGRRRVPWKGLAQAALVVMPWALFSLYEFHNVFPATLKQKMWQGRSGFWGDGWVYWDSIKELLAGRKIWITALALPAAAGAVRMIRDRSPMLYFVGFAFFQQAAYVLLNVPGYHWYHASAVAAFVVLAAYGTGEGALLAKRAIVRGTGAVPAAASLALAVCLLAYSGFTYYRLSDARKPDSRTVAYRALSMELVRKTPPGSLAALEVGVVGYYTGREMVDLLGLTSAKGEFATGKNNDAFFRMLPGVVVIHNYVSTREEAIFNDPRFGKYYEVGGYVDSPNYQRLFFYVRKS